MKTYSHYEINEFIICCGYKGYVIKEWFSNYFLYTSNVTFDLQKNEMTIHDCHSENWKVTLVDTGLETVTSGRIKRVQNRNETSLLIYGEGNLKVFTEKPAGDGSWINIGYFFCEPEVITEGDST